MNAYAFDRQHNPFERPSYGKEPVRQLSIDDIEPRIEEYKDAFAKYVARGTETFQAALLVFGQEQVGLAYYCGQRWPADDRVVELIKQYKGELAPEVLPSRDDLALEIHKATKAHFVFEDKLKGYKLLADILGYIDKGGPVVNNNVINNRVMVVKDMGDEVEFEQRARDQQRKLINAAAEKPKG